MGTLASRNGPQRHCSLSPAVDVGFVERQRVRGEREHVVAEDQDLVAAALVLPDEVLARAELVRVHDVEQPLPVRRLLQVRAVELGRHRAPHLDALTDSDHTRAR